MPHKTITNSDPQVGDEVNHHDGGNVYKTVVESISENNPFVRYSLKILESRQGYNRFARSIGDVIEISKIKGAKY
ncbi:MAG: hypothetical protein WA139_02780 [Candidatus Aenigmatarchaeota archaeon]